MTENCTSSIPSVHSFSKEVLWSLRIINFVIGLLNIFGNSLLIYALKKTGQTTTISLQLIVLMSVSDIANGTVALSLTNILLWKKSDSDCYLKLTTQCLHRLFLAFSFGTVLLIALDRFLHIKYLQRYPVIMPKRRMWYLTSFIFCFYTLAAVFSSMPFLNDYMKVGNMVHVSLAAVGMIAVFVLYCKTLRAISYRVSSMGNIFIQSTLLQIKTISNVALCICICTLVLLTPHILGVIILGVRSPRAPNATELAIFKWYAYLGMLVNGVCNCVIFALHNKPVKRFIIRMIMHNQ